MPAALPWRPILVPLAAVPALAAIEAGEISQAADYRKLERDLWAKYNNQF